MRAKPVARVALVVEDAWIVRDHIAPYDPADIVAALHTIIAAE
jgi:hypothetical protein